MEDGYDSIEILCSGVSVNGVAYAYGPLLDVALEPVIARVQTRTRNARDDVDVLKYGGLLTRLTRFFDDLVTSVPARVSLDEPYLDAIVRAHDLMEAGRLIERCGVMNGGTLRFYAGIEKRTHEDVYRVRFRSDPPITGRPIPLFE
ncbi:MAG: hypothetical protein ACMXYM_03725 [Candidatus Woesearchaeota archaeon]